MVGFSIRIKYSGGVDECNGDFATVDFYFGQVGSTM